MQYPSWLRVFIFSILIGFFSLSPLGVSAQIVDTFFQPIIPQSGPCVCPGTAPDYGCVLQVIQNGTNTLVGVGIIFIVLVLAYAGLMFMTSGANPSSREKGRTLILNAVFGLLVILSAWLIVDFIMKAIYRSESSFGPWNSILGPAPDGSDNCIDPSITVPITTTEIFRSVFNTGTLYSSTGQGACNPTLVQNAATQGGIQMSTSEARTIACIAGPESSCGKVLENYNWNGKKSPPPSSAYGPFQILLKGNSKCFDTPACYRAAGVRGPLDCSKAFDARGYAIPGVLLQQCKTAAANLSCSAVAADCVVQRQGYGAWSGNKDSTPAHKACIANNAAR